MPPLLWGEERLLNADVEVYDRDTANSQMVANVEAEQFVLSFRSSRLPTPAFKVV